MTTSTTLPPQASQPAGSDFARLQQQYGGGGGGGSYQDPSDPDVYWGTTDSQGRTRRQNPIIKRSEALVAPAKWKREDLAAFQRRMFDAGLYGSLKESEVPFGVFDLNSQMAWKDLVDAAVAYQAVGKKVRPQDILTELPSGIGGGGVGAQPSPSSNPLDLQALAKSTSTDVLGRGLTPEETRRVAGKLGAAEAPFLNPNSSVERPGAGAFRDIAKQQVRALDPVRADSRSVVKVAGVLSQMLEGRTAQAQLPSQGQ